MQTADGQPPVRAAAGALGEAAPSSQQDRSPRSAPGLAQEAGGHGGLKENSVTATDAQEASDKLEPSFTIQNHPPPTNALRQAGSEGSRPGLGKGVHETPSA